MTKFYDENKTIGIEMLDENTGCSWENDFFEVGQLPYNEELSAYRVEDVDYLVDYATSYADGTNGDIEYPVDDDGNVTLPGTTVTVEEL